MRNDLAIVLISEKYTIFSVKKHKAHFAILIFLYFLRR